MATSKLLSAVGFLALHLDGIRLLRKAGFWRFSGSGVLGGASVTLIGRAFVYCENSGRGGDYFIQTASSIICFPRDIP